MLSFFTFETNKIHVLSKGCIRSIIVICIEVKITDIVCVPDSPRFYKIDNKFDQWKWKKQDIQFNNFTYLPITSNIDLFSS